MPGIPAASKKASSSFAFSPKPSIAQDDRILEVSEDNYRLAAYVISAGALLENDKGGASRIIKDAYSTTGALVSISADRQAVLYDTNGKFEYLAEGEKVSDIFLYTIQLGNGLTSQAKVAVEIIGANDAAVILGGSDDDISAADKTDNRAHGQLLIEDADWGQSIFIAETLAGQYGSLTIDMFGTWTYSLDAGNQEVRALAEGQMNQDRIAIKSFDGTEHVIQIDVEGSNDSASISFGPDDGAKVTEDVDVFTSGTLLVIDDDAGEAIFASVAPKDLSGKYGEFGFDAETGEWSYALDVLSSQNLREGQFTFDTLVVESLDGTAAKMISVTIEGQNDLATISGDLKASVLSTSNSVVSGVLDIVDPDKGQAQFRGVAARNLDNEYGQFNFDRKSGEWSFTLNDERAQALAEGERAVASFEVVSLDRTARSMVEVEILGPSEPPAIRTVFDFENVATVPGTSVPWRGSDGFTWTTQGGNPVIADRFFYAGSNSTPSDFLTTRNNIGFQVGPTTVSRNGDAFDFVSAELSSFGGQGSATFKGLNNGVEIFSKTVELVGNHLAGTSNMQNTDFGFDDIDTLQIITNGWIMDNATFDYY